MVDRKMLIILCLLAFQVFVGRGLQSQTDELIQQAQFQQRNILREKILSSQNEQAPLLAKLAERSQSNRSLCYPPEVNISNAMADLQQRIEKAGADNGVSLINLRAGEPHRVAEQLYKQLPVSFSFSGTPAQVGGFLRDLFRTNRFLRVYSADIRPVKKQRLRVTISLAASQLLAPQPQNGSAM